MQASLYDWIVYQRRYKARERKGEKEDGWCGGLVLISCEGRQGASGNRDNRRKQYHTIWNCTRHYKTVCAVTLPPLQKSLPLSFVCPLLYLWGVLIFVLFQQLIVFTIPAFHPFIQVLQQSRFIGVMAVELLYFLGLPIKFYIGYQVGSGLYPFQLIQYFNVPLTSLQASISLTFYLLLLLT